VSLRRRELGKNLPPVKQVSITEAQDKVVSLSGSGVIVSWASTLKRPVKSGVSHHRLLISSKRSEQKPTAIHKESSDLRRHPRTNAETTDAAGDSDPHWCSQAKVFQKAFTSDSDPIAFRKLTF
jgi:hypothetical protein